MLRESRIPFACISAVLVFVVLCLAAELPCECEDWRKKHPEWIWCDGFEDGKELKEKYQDVKAAPQGFGVSADDAFTGKHSLHQHYEKGQVDAGWVAWYYDSAVGEPHGKSYDEIYFRWYHKFEKGFEGAPPKMARIRSVGAGYKKRFSVLYWIASGSPQLQIVADVHMPYSSQANDVGWLPVIGTKFSFADSNNIGRWICHEAYVKKNTPGKKDGAYRFWADGTLIAERVDCDLVGDTPYEFNMILLDAYWNKGSPKAQNRYYDNFVISTKYVGLRKDDPVKSDR